MQCTVTQLSQKEVISVDTAARVGAIADVEFDMDTGEMVGICVAVGGGMFRSRPPIRIARQDIIRIGADSVLVRNVPPPPPAGERKPLFGFMAK